MRKKKGDLNLSINAIVVLILAITMLGLGLGFMRNIFGGATAEFQKVGGTVEKQMIDQMRESNKIVDLSRPKVKLKIGDKDSIYIGFKNDQPNEVAFAITSADCSVIGSDTDCGNAGESDVWIETKRTPTTVQKGEVYVLPINIRTNPAAKEANTYFFDIIVSVGDAEQTRHVELTVDLVV
jgi:hypothetical protein